MNATFQIDFNNESEVKELKELLEIRLIQLQSQTPDNDNQNDLDVAVNVNPNDNITVLHQFVNQASKNQLEVLKWMKANPGNISAHVLKKELPFLAPHGALSGVFRAGRWVKLSGGTKDGFPFFQIGWNHEKGCGIYRGLTQEEADALNM